MPYERKPVSLNDFQPSEDSTDADLLEISFDSNLESIFVHHRGINRHTQQLRWVLHEDFVPASIRNLREPGMDYSQDIGGRPFDVPVEVSATVGEPAGFTFHPGKHVWSNAVVTSITPCHYRDAYDDDLTLRTVVHA